MKIVNFHEILNPDWFDTAVQVLRENYEIVNFQAVKDFYCGKNKGKNQVHITVDDGHISTYTVIYRLLKELGLSASIFVSPNIIRERKNFWYEEIRHYDNEKLKAVLADTLHIPQEKLTNFYTQSVLKTLKLEEIHAVIRHYKEKYNPGNYECQYITEDQLLEMEHSGIIHIGAHTQTHPILANESYRESEIQIKESVQELSEMLGRKITTFAYPNGSPGLDYGTREKKTLQSCGVDYAFSFIFRDCSKNDDLLEIPRYGLYHGNADFIRKKLRFGPYWEPVKRLLFQNEDKHRKEIMKALNDNN